MRWIGGAIVLAGVGGVAGACGPSVFACSSDEQCESSGVAGMCQTEGYCSFPDESCPSGQRFGDAAPSDVANACVDASEGGTSTGPGPAESTGDGVEPPDFDVDGTPESTTTAAVDDDGATTSPLDDGTSTGPIPEPTTGEGSDGTTTGAGEACAESIVDAFDGTEISPMWNVFTQASTEVWVENGQLVFGVGPAPEWVVAGTIFEVETLAGGWERVHVTEADESGLLIAGGAVASNGICQLQLYVAPNGGVDASLWNARTLTTTGLGYEESPGLPLWLQIRMDEQGESYFEWSPDAITWNQLANGTFPECGDWTGVIVMGVNVGGQLDAGEGTRMIDGFEACLP